MVARELIVAMRRNGVYRFVTAFKGFEGITWRVEGGRVR